MRVRSLTENAPRRGGLLARPIGGVHHRIGRQSQWSASLAAELLKRETGIDALHVPYRGAAPAVNDLLGEQLDLMFGDGPVVLPQILGNLLTPVVLATDKRLPVLPDVPTSIEAGFPTVRSENWYGVLAPKRTPRPIIEALDQADCGGDDQAEDRGHVLPSKASMSSRKARPRRSLRSSPPNSTSGVAWRRMSAPEWTDTACKNTSKRRKTT